jgi:hypothetical protein
VSFDEFPKEGKTDPDAYKTAIDALPKGSASKWKDLNLYTSKVAHFA